MGKANIKNILLITVVVIILTFVMNAGTGFFALKDVYTLVIIVVSTLLLMIIFDYRKNDYDKNIKRFRTNIFLVSLLISFSEMFSKITDYNSKANMGDIILAFKPMVIGIYVYMVFINIAQGHEVNSDEVSENKDFAKSVESNEKIVIDTSLDKTKQYKKLSLTRRESEIFELLLEDLSNKDIAEKLFIAETTVKKHVQNILKKADCGNRLELIEKYKV